DFEWAEPHVNLKEQYRIMKRMRNGIGLRKAIEGEGIEFTGQHHRGISDAENLVKLFLKYLHPKTGGEIEKDRFFIIRHSF
ncbi:MAG TPA: hypothetical protein PKN76_06835, partial [bacterium]|nr:hypothetical protein [bacterium]